jgi:PAS domain S-box-containing protein
LLRRDNIATKEIKYHLLIQNTNIGIVSLFNDGTYNEVNPVFCGMTGFDKNDLRYNTFPEPFWSKHFFDELEKDFHIFKNTGVFKAESFFKRKNGMFFPVSIKGSMIKDDKTGSSEFVLFIEDISNRKQPERELKLSQDMLIAINSKLQQMVKDRTNEIDELIIRKNNFINQLGHDLKNPLNPLINLTPILESKISDPEAKEIIQLFKRNIEYMRQLIIKTIALAKLNSPTIQFNFEPCNTIEEIKKVIENNKYLFEKNNMNIKTIFKSNPVIEIDKLRVNELLVNILDNTIKYSPDGGTVTVKVDEIKDKYAQISITDQGKGMNEEQINHIFEDFYRAQQTSNTFKSSGLGMSICKRIVEKHSGQIWVESEGLGKGTSVVFTIPYNQPEIEDTYSVEIEKMEKVVDCVKKHVINKSK